MNNNNHVPTNRTPNAMKIKNWCVDTFSASSWLIIVSRCYPELLQCDRKVSIVNIHEKTVFDEDHVRVLNRCIVELYDCVIPEPVSGYFTAMEGKKGFKIEWLDRVTGRMKISYTLKRPITWFTGLLKQ
ncbi:MAG: hypothetical protein ABJF11_01055 [Reichenbachiella sp.]|uniref:hypothetical protein n=1 Tax=Reichenbachiella sp. TaxID=2184521 RepID=UPI0032661E19